MFFELIRRRLYSLQSVCNLLRTLDAVNRIANRHGRRWRGINEMCEDAE